MKNLTNKSFNIERTTMRDLTSNEMRMVAGGTGTSDIPTYTITSGTTQPTDPTDPVTTLPTTITFEQQK